MLRPLALTILVSAYALAGPASAAPNIASASPRGLQIGQPTTLLITGSDLPADARVLIAGKIAGQTIKPGAKSDRVEIEVTLDPATSPGLYPIRVAGSGGISNPIVIGVDRLPQVAFETEPKTLPIALHGAVGAAQVLKMTLAGKKGQRLVLDVEAQRLGAGLKPVLRLYDARGTQIAWSPPRAIIGGDARVEALLAADAQYTVELHDQLYRPAGPGYFRLKIGDLQFADLALPLGATTGSKQAVRFASSNIPDVVELDLTANPAPGETASLLPAAERYSGAAPRIAVSDFPELVENPAAGGQLQELPAAPVAISGLLSAANEEDRFLLNVTPGQKLRVEVTARRFGSPLDAVLSIRNEQGGSLASGDDRPGSSDPMVEYTVPAGVNRIVLAIKDLLGRGGSDFVYRMVAADTSRPDFSLSLATDRINVPSGGTQVIPIQVTRTNYAGPIALSLEGQPAELQLQGSVIPAGATIGLLTLSAAPGSPQATLSRLIGQSASQTPPVRRAATFGDFPGAKYQPRVKTELGLAITQPAPLGLVWLPGDNDQLFLGGKLPARVQLTRAEGTKGKTRLKLLTTQPTPKKTVKENNQDKVVDDLDRALRLEGDATFADDQKDVTAQILVPGDLPRQPWDLVLVAELLSADGKTVVASIAAPVRTLSPVAPFTLALTGPNAAEGKAGAGEPGKLVGKIERSPGYTQSVVVTLDGLPKGYSAPQVIVPADKSEFELPLTFAFGSKAGELKGAKLVGIAAPVVATSVRSNTLDVAINVVAGEKPAAEPPKEIFEDDEKFAALLTEGEGRAIPDQRDKYSGTYSLRITGDQKFNPNLPNLGMKIRENPGPGEYRYIRFAWKKAGGNSICLQLNHDGTWGPGGTGREGAKFRYHAGPGGECYGASLTIDEKLPAPRFVVVTRDLFADFGEFTLTGLAFSPVDGQAALFDHLYLARQPEDFSLLKVEKQ
ncbi:MAG TPA: hypothetical protein VFB80_04650 [Pirellulaceae bacterium]|nr:hypothetical protein [Pirellulaceae bacterium]